MDFDDRIKRHLHEEAATVNADNSLLDDLKRRAGGRRRRRQLMLAGAGVAAAAAVAFGVVLAQDDKPAETGVVAPGPTSTESPPLTGTSSTAPTTTTTARPKTDWDNVRFDLGVIKEFRQEGGTWLLAFDRIRFTDGEEGPKSAPEFTEEPVLCCHTDAMTQNDNPMVRTYAVSPQVEVLEIGNRPYTCPGDWESQRPRWESRPFGEIVKTTKWDQWDGVALTFDLQGNVIRIRLGGGC